MTTTITTTRATTTRCPEKSPPPPSLPPVRDLKGWARLGRMVKVRKAALLSQAKWLCESESCIEWCLHNDDDNDDDDVLRGFITHVHEDKSKVFTGMVELTIGKYKNWMEVHDELQATNYETRPRSFFPWVEVGELEAKGDMVYVNEDDGIQLLPPPIVPVMSPTWYHEKKVEIERAEEEERMREAIRAKREATGSNGLANKNAAKTQRKKFNKKSKKKNNNKAEKMNRQHSRNNRAIMKKKINSIQRSSSLKTQRKRGEVSSKVDTAVKVLMMMATGAATEGTELYYYEDQPWEIV